MYMEMELQSIAFLVVASVLAVEVVLMLTRMKVDKMLLLMPITGVILAALAFALNEYREKLLSSLSESARSVVIYVIVAMGIILGLMGIVIWLRGEKEAKKLVATARSIDSAVTRMESEIRGSGVEIEHFDEEMSDIKRKISDYEAREKEV